MGLDARQLAIPGGHLIVADADVADGHAHFRLTWTDVTSGNQVVDSVLTKRDCWLNGGLVKDPQRALALWQEAMRL